MLPSLIPAGGAWAELLGLPLATCAALRSRGDARPGLHQFFLDLGGLDVDRAGTFRSASNPESSGGEQIRQEQASERMLLPSFQCHHQMTPQDGDLLDGRIVLPRLAH